MSNRLRASDHFPVDLDTGDRVKVAVDNLCNSPVYNELCFVDGIDSATVEYPVATQVCDTVRTAALNHVHQHKNRWFGCLPWGYRAQGATEDSPWENGEESHGFNR